MKVYSENKKAFFNYQILEKIEAGVSLIGQEVKSIKLGKANLSGSFVIIKDEQAYLVGCNIPPYQPKNAPPDYNPQRERKLLLKKNEIKYLLGKSKEKRLTLIPLRFYDKKGKIKLEIALVRGKKKVEKKEEIKKREIDRELKRILKEKS